MKSKLATFFLLVKQYSIGEMAALGALLTLDLFRIRISSYLIRTKNSFGLYFTKGYPVKRNAKNTIITFKDLTISLRRNSSDFLVFDQIMDAGELDAVINVIHENKISIGTVLDCGANIGLSALYLSNQLPHATIIAIEPEPENFAQLKINIENNSSSKIKAIQVGAWSRTALLEHDTNFCNAKHWAFSVREPSGAQGTIAVDTIDNIVDAAGASTVDYLKMDIEGAEFEVFRNPHTWKKTFQKLKVISIEVHEKKGPAEEIKEILKDNGFTITISGELVIGWRNQIEARTIEA